MTAGPTPGPAPGLVPVVLRRLVRLRSAAGEIVELPPGSSAQLPASLAHQLLIDGAAVRPDAPPAPPEPERQPWPPENPASLPTIGADGALRIPFDAPARFRWWQGGQTAEQTLAELRRADPPPPAKPAEKNRPP